jgi:pimeloyl-ACP methyl ester carboxylesterase
MLEVAPWAQAALVGPAKAMYIQESRRDRREVYNADFRRWHWRICAEMLGFQFDSAVPQRDKPLLLLVGDKDDCPGVHFLSCVQKFAQSLSRPPRTGLANA